MTSPAPTARPHADTPAPGTRHASCQRSPALFVLTWPDTRFELCQVCVPADLVT